jgi:soluble lytic murein transglycosylase-like protein
MGRKRRARSGWRSARAALLVPLWRVLAVPGVRKALVIAAVYVVALNAIVRYVGHGDAFLLSVLRVPEKSYAVAALGLHSVTHLWSGHDEDMRALVTAAALEHGVPVSLALAIARTESGLQPHCISSTGAMGLMQLMPATALAHGVIDPYDPAQNALGASSFLHELSRRYGGDRARIAAAYNAGAGRVPRRGPLSDLPAETRVYVSRVLGNRAR